MLEDLAIPVDVSHYNALLRVYNENEHGFSPDEFLAALQTKKIEPNRVTYQRLMARYCQQGDMDGATRILQIMRDQQLPVNEGVFNTLLMGHTQAGDMESALSIVDLMQQASVNPSEETYTALMCGYAKSGDMEAVSKLLQECKDKEICLQDKDYMDIIYALAYNNHPQHVDKVIMHLQKTWGYNQDVINLILRLININQLEVSMKMLKTMPRALLPDGKPAPGGTFLIRQLVKTKQPVEKIVEICEQLVQQDLHPRALQLAAEHSLHLGSEHSEQSVALMQVLKISDPSMKQHQFWPLLVSNGKNGDVPGMLKVLENMKVAFQLPPSGVTLRDHVIPYLPKDMSSEDIIATLKSGQVSHASAASAVLCTRLAQNNIAEAANIADNNTAHYPPALLRRPLTVAYLQSNDLTSYLTILRNITNGLSQGNALNQSTDVAPNSTDVVGAYLMELEKLLDPPNKTAVLATVLQGLVDEALAVSKEKAEQLREKLGNTMTEEMSALLDCLTAGDLTPPTRAVKPGRSSRFLGQTDVANLERLKTSLEEQSESTLSIRKQLLSQYCRNRDLEKAEAIKASLDQDNVVYTGGPLAQLIDLYTHHEMLDPAWSTYQILQQREPDFPLDHSKVLRMAGLLVKHDRLKDCIQLLNDQGKDRELLTDPSYLYNNLCWKLLNGLAESGKVDELKQVFDSLVENKFLAITNALLGPFVKVHIVRGDLPAALQEFERCCRQHNVTPYKNDLACKLIMAEDSNALQKLTDLSTTIHGEVNSLFDLVFSFVECGKIRHAKRILETPGLGSRPQRINSACERYRQEGLAAPLEGLLDATKDSAHIVDRCLVSDNLLQIYVLANEVDKALELWTRMQEEDISASDKFLSHLGKLLQKNGRDVPFVIPENSPVRTVTETVRKPALRQVTQPTKPIKPIAPPSIPSPTLRLRQVLRAEILEADSKGNQLDKQNLPPSYTEELRKMAADLLSSMLEKKEIPKIRELKFALKQLAPAGELASIEAIGKLVPETMKKLVNYEKCVCIASVIAGKGEEYLKKLELRINEAKDSDLEMLRDTYPRAGSTYILVRHPELKERFEEMARTYAVRDILFPINDLWAYLFESGQESQAGELWSEFLARSPRVVVEHVLETARSTKDSALAQRLVNQLKGSEKLPGIVGSAYSSLIEILVVKKQSDEALKVLDDAIKEDNFEDVKRLPLKKLEKLLVSEGKTLPPHVINLRDKVNSSSSSSSSSDEEK